MKRKNDRFMLLRQKLNESGITRMALADKLGYSYHCLYKRLAGDTEWTIYDIKVISQEMGLNDTDIVNCFLERQV